MIASVSSRPGRRPDPALHQLWQQRLDRFAQSQLSAAAFCSAEGLSVHSFYAWRRRLRQSPTLPQRPVPPRLLPVRVATATPVEVVLPAGCVLRLLPGCDLDFVRTLVASLGDAPC
jgi:transposase